MRLNDIADVARGAGLRTIEVTGWKSRGHGDLTAVETVVCHHTAGPSTGNMPSLGVVRDGRAGLSGPLCNLGLARDGTVYVVAAGVAYHAGAVTQTSYDNWHAIGIEAEATGTTSWPAAQMDAYARLCRALADHYKFPVSHVLGHKEVCKPTGRKVDPNFDMVAFRNKVAAVQPNEEDDDMTPEDRKLLTDIHAQNARMIGQHTATLAEEGKRLTAERDAVMGAIKAQGDRIVAAIEAAK